MLKKIEGSGTHLEIIRRWGDGWLCSGNRGTEKELSVLDAVWQLTVKISCRCTRGDGKK